MKNATVVFIAVAALIILVLDPQIANRVGIPEGMANVLRYGALLGICSNLVLDTVRRKRVTDSQSDQSTATSQRSTAMLTLTRTLAEQSGSLSVFLTAICETLLASMKIDEVAIWLCHKNPHTLSCCRSISRQAGEVSKGEEIPLKACQPYLKLLTEKNSLRIDDLEKQAKNVLLPDSLFRTKENRALLSVPVTVDGRALGMVHIEKPSEPDSWSEEEVAFAETVTCLLSKALREFELRQIVEELRRADGTYRSAIENAAGVPYRLRLTDRQYEFIGAGLESLVGIPADEFTLDTLKNMTKEVIFTDRHGPSDPLEYVNAFSNGKLSHYRADVRIETPDGRMIWLSDCSIPLYDESGNVSGSLGIIQDVTERKLVEDALRVSEERYRLLVESLSEGLFIEDENGTIIYVNRKFCEMLGYDETEIIGKLTTDFLTQESKDLLDKHPDSTEEFEESLEVEWTVKNGDCIHTLMSPIAIPDTEKQQTLKFSAVVDITRRIEAERSVIQHNKRLTTLNDVAKIVTGSRAPEEIAGRLLGVIERTVPCDAFAVYHYIEDENALLPLFCCDTIDGKLRDITHRFSKEKPDKTLRKVLKEREPLLIQRGNHSPGDVNMEDKCLKYPSVIFVPLVVNEKSLGILMVQSRSFRAYSLADMDMLIAIAQQTGPALEATLLSKQILQSEEQEREFGEKLASLVKVTNLLATTESLDTLCRKAVELGQKELGFERISLWFISDEPGVAVGSFGVDEKGEIRDERGRRLRYDNDHVIGRILDKEEPWVTLEKSPLLNHLADIVGEGTLAASAIWDGEKVIGCLSTDNLLSHKQLDERNARLLRLYGSVIGTLYSRKSAEQALREADVIYRTAIENASGVPYRLRFEDWSYDFIGSGLGAILNLQPESFSHQSFQEMILERVVADSNGPSDPKQYKSDFLSGKLSLYRMDLKVALKDNTEKWLNDTQVPYYDSTGKLVGGLGILQDITQRKLAEDERHRLEAQIQHSQKLESLGILAGGIAHDFNNLLMGILGNADLALMEMPSVAPARDNVKQIETAAMRAADLTRQMLAYSGKGQFLIQPLNLAKLIEEMAHLLEVSISKKAILRYDFDFELPSVQGDPSQLRQVFMNLITNASDALTDKSGIITIRTGVMHADRSYFANTYLDENLPEGTYVFAEVSDTGCGMPPEVQAKIFDPFFTTKFTGRGLGLAAVLGIVRGHRGAIRVYSNAGLGTTFKVLLPSSDKEAVPFKIDESELGQWRGEGTILVVDDEEIVLAVAKQALEGSGFRVLQARDGQEGVDIYKEHSKEIKIVLLDMTMPCMDGEEAFREIRRINKNARVILSSGYNEQEATTRFAGKGLAGFIQKPYRPVELIKQLRAILVKREA